MITQAAYIYIWLTAAVANLKPRAVVFRKVSSIAYKCKECKASRAGASNLEL